MKILWANTTFLHPTTRGGQIRTLEMLKRLHAWHEVHYTALADPGDEEEGVERSKEYCSHVYPVPYRTVSKNSPEFAVQLLRGAVSPVPVVIFRRRSARMKRFLAELLRRERFDVIICDFLVSSINMPRLDTSVLFQHNVETIIWRRFAQNATDPFRKAYFGLQSRKMFAYEGKVCRAVKHVITVSDADASLIRDMFRISNVTAAPTGVDVEYFYPRNGSHTPDTAADVVFIGSMDYMANIDGVLYFAREILPQIRRRRPETTVAIVGRKPPAKVMALTADPLIRVTGSVPDVRPYLWTGAVSIVPLRVGGGTRLKIYESMAAGAAVVSTTVGAEGLVYEPGRNIEIADTPQAFANACVDLLENPDRRRFLASEGLRSVQERFSWEAVTRVFERILESKRLS
jgi:sugar transferase (PEP-CTERM/EpsH1 system associated)